MFKDILLSINAELNAAMKNTKKSIMRESIEEKLNNSEEFYKDQLRLTCEYVLMRNPVVMAKNLEKVTETYNKQVKEQEKRLKEDD